MPEWRTWRSPITPQALLHAPEARPREMPWAPEMLAPMQMQVCMDENGGRAPRYKQPMFADTKSFSFAMTV